MRKYKRKIAGAMAVMLLLQGVVAMPAMAEESVKDVWQREAVEGKYKKIETKAVSSGLERIEKVENRSESTRQDDADRVLKSEEGLEAEEGLRAKKGSEVEKGLEIEESLESEEGLKAEKGLEAGKALEVEKGLEAEKDLEIKKGLEAEGGLKTEEGLEIEEGLANGGNLRIEEDLKIGETAEDEKDLQIKKAVEIGNDWEEMTVLATGSNAEENIFLSMPEPGTEEFTLWFFGHTGEADLWNWMFAVMEGQENDLYEAFMAWYEIWEEKVTEEYHRYAGVEVMSSSVGDFWENWNSNMDFPGDGTRQAPYQIDSLSRLMGLSEAVAAGMGFEGEYFELTQDIDLGSLLANSGSWNPIGWYQNQAELGGEVRHPFRGHFDGGGNTISGLRIVNPSLGLTNIGLFGVIDGGSVKNLNIEAEDIVGEDKTGILAGAILGDANIAYVTVSGFVNSNGNAGGIAGEVTGSSNRVTIENCRAESIVLNSEGRDSYVGGIAGNVQNAWLIDNTATTQNGDANRIRGKGYVGGIAGRISQTDVYNSYVSGTIGGNGSRAVGGIVGQYRSGNLILARMAGKISATNNGTASREGTFVGTRESRDRFTYGTEKDSNFSYLFTNDGAKAKNVLGSTIDGDNTFTKDAHIGYWTDNERKYKIVSGRTETDSGNRYFYEELEDGVRYIVTQKLDREFTSSDYASGISFRMDHFAPGYMGEPVKGYLVSIPRIDTRNDNGTYDTDVAELTAISATSNSYYRTIDKDHGAAIVAGSVVTVATAPKNTGENRYQMVVDSHVPGGVKAPTFLDENGRTVDMDYVNGGAYTFVMPECDTELNAEYIKVTTRLEAEPSETDIHIVQTRSGDRKNPKIVTEVTNKEGILIARYIDENPDTSVQVQPVTIHGRHNGTGWTADRTMRWSVDDTNLLTNLSDSGYTGKDAVIMPNLSSAFVQGIINREVQSQADGQYQEKINNTIYTQHAVVTAATNPDTSVDNRAVYANCRVNVTFQIVDNTTVRVEGLKLNRDHVDFTVTRKLTGDRLNPQETLVVSQPVILTATLSPVRPFFKNVSWKAGEEGKILSLVPSGNNTQDCQVSVNYDPSGEKNPAWIQNIILEDNEKRRLHPYERITGSAVYEEIITAASEDQTNGHVTYDCPVTVYFVTEDETVIHPEGISLNREKIDYSLSYDYTGYLGSVIKSKNGFGVRDRLTAVISPCLEEKNEYSPYDRTVLWTSSDPNAVTVADGVITIRDGAEWMQEALKTYPYEAERTVVITAKTRDGGYAASCELHLSFKANALYAGYGGGSGGSSSGGGGGGSSGGSGGSGKSTGASGVGGTSGTVIMAGTDVPKSALPGDGLPDYVVAGNWSQGEDGKWRFSDKVRFYADEWAAIVNPYADPNLGQSNFDWFRFDKEGRMVSGWYTDADGKIYYLNPSSDGTQGRMFTGWNWIRLEDGKEYCYYFNEKSDGTKGALFCGKETPDGYAVDQKGRWTVGGVPETR